MLETASDNNTSEQSGGGVLGDIARSTWRKLKRRQHFRGQQLRAGLERPLFRQVLPEKIHVQGWAVSMQGLPLRGRVLVNDRESATLTIAESRPDVASRFALAAGEDRVGFSGLINWSDIDSNLSEAAVSVEIECGDEVMVLGPVPVFRSYQLALPEEGFQVCLEKPQTNDAAAEIVEVQGWVSSPDNRGVEGRLIVEGQCTEGSKQTELEPQYYQLLIDQNREDVSEALGLQAHQSQLGFAHRVKWSDFAVEVDRAKLRFEFRQGANVVSMGPVTVFKTGSRQLRHMRGNYKEVWNEQSVNERLAMDSVAAIPNYDDFMKSGESSSETLISQLDITRSDEVLEIGCGTARIGAAMAPHCKRWVGADISSNMLKFAEKNVAGHKNVDLVELSGCDLSMFGDASLDKIYCCTVFMHLDEWDRYRYVAEVFRTLRPGGKCYFDNINLAGDTGWDIFQELSQIDPATRPPMISKTSTTEEIDTYLQRAGFIDIEKYPNPHFVALVGRKPA